MQSTRQVKEIVDYCRLALAKGDLSALNGATSLSNSGTEVVSQLSGEELELVIQAMVEAGRLTLALEMLEQSFVDSLVAPEFASRLLARIGRQSCRPIERNSETALILATNAWVDGHLVDALASAELALLSHVGDLDALITKAYVLWEQGYVDDSQSILTTLGDKSSSPLIELEIAALSTLIAIDRKITSLKELTQFRKLASSPNLSPEVEMMVDFWQLQISWRQGHSDKKSPVLSRLSGHPFISPYQLATGNKTSQGRSSQGGLRTLVGERLVQARRASSRRQARVCVSQAIELAQPQKLVSPFIQFGPPVAGLIVEILSSSPSRFADRVLSQMSMSRIPDESRLNDRELFVLRLFATGMTADQIASDLGISTETVKSHSHHAIVKLGVSRRAEAIALLHERGLIPVQPKI